MSNETILVVSRDVGRTIDQNGREVINVKREVVRNEINFGSLMKPKNTDVVSFEYRDKAPSMNDLLGGLFK